MKSIVAKFFYPKVFYIPNDKEFKNNIKKIEDLTSFLNINTDNEDDITSTEEWKEYVIVKSFTHLPYLRKNLKYHNINI